MLIFLIPDTAAVIALIFRGLPPTRFIIFVQSGKTHKEEFMETWHLLRQIFQLQDTTIQCLPPLSLLPERFWRTIRRNLILLFWPETVIQPILGLNGA